MESVKDSEETRKERKKSAVSKEAESSEEETFKQGKKRLAEFVIGVKESLGGQQASGRRRRSTCKFISPIQVRGQTDDTFWDYCLNA